MTTRIDLPLAAACSLCAAALPAVGCAQADPAPAAATAPAKPPASGWHWIVDWARLPKGEEIGSTHGCLCVDKQGRIFANTETERAVLVFQPDGTLVESWGKEY